MQTEQSPHVPAANGRIDGQLSGQKLPTEWRRRESLREKGQFWTPGWLAKVMASWVTEIEPDTLFDPAVGPGTFFSAARAVGYEGPFDGFEMHEAALAEGSEPGLSGADFTRIKIADFLSSHVKHIYPAIISNPPYIRHHRLGEERKRELRTISERVIGFALDGRVGLHVYFLLKCLEHLSPAGRLAFLLPADVCEGISSRALWARLCERFHLEAVLTFDASAAPFPQVDTNAMVFFISHSQPHPRLKWLRARERDGEAILNALRAGNHGHGQGKGPNLNSATSPSLPVPSPHEVGRGLGRGDRCFVAAQQCASDKMTVHYERELSEALATGLSRPPRPPASRGVPLRHFARVVRGIATGANEFFFLTERQAKSLQLEPQYFVRAIGRTRDCRADILRSSNLEELELAGRPTWVLNLDATPKEQLPAALRSHLDSGEQRGLHLRPLIKSRRPWYKMERRSPPPILFAYLGRRDCRFVLNEAGVVPLTGFLCVYPLDPSPEAVRRLWRALNHSDTIQNLAFAGKSYGSGAVKVEPRQLDRLEIPFSVLQEAGLKSK